MHLYQITALLMLIYAGMLMALTSVCLPGQARWGGEEEQGDEGGGLSVDEGGGKSQKNVSFFAVKKRKERKKELKSTSEKEKVKCESSPLIDVLVLIQNLAC